MENFSKLKCGNTLMCCTPTVGYVFDVQFMDSKVYSGNWQNFTLNSHPSIFDFRMTF